MKIKFIQKIIDVIRGKGKQKELFYEKGEITKIKVPKKSKVY